MAMPINNPIKSTSIHSSRTVAVKVLVERVLTVGMTDTLDESVTVVLATVLIGVADEGELGSSLIATLVVITGRKGSLTCSSLVEPIIALWTHSLNVSACSISFSTSS